MAIEIERKFLVTDDTWQHQVKSSEKLIQGYLSANAKATVRVRLFDDRRAVLTLKGKTEGMSRQEFEYPIPLDDARALLALVEPNTLEKTRYIVPFGGLDWEIDVFAGRHAGLVVAEVELESEDQPVALPPWVGREVTEDDRYFNASLARAAAPPL